jgi:hypothetical protein
MQIEFTTKSYGDISRQRYSASHFRWRRRWREIRDNEAERGREWGGREMEQEEREQRRPVAAL